MLRLSAAAYRRFARAAATSSSVANSATNTVAKASSAYASSNSVALRSFTEMPSGSHLSSFAEPGSLFTDQPQAAVMEESLSAPLNPADKDAALRADVRTMGSLLGHIIQEHHGKEVFEKIEELRALAKKWREAGAGRKADTAAEADQFFSELADKCSELSNAEMLVIARAFTHFLAIANSAEAHHRVRMLRKSTTFEALPERYDSW